MEGDTRFWSSRVAASLNRGSAALELSQQPLNEPL
jgi:hypothetical protein